MSQPYDGVCTGSQSPFPGWLRRACDTTGSVRCVFPDSREKHRLIGEIRLKHLDEQCLGQAFDEEMFAFASASTHFEMLHPEHLLKCLGDYVKAIMKT